MSIILAPWAAQANSLPTSGRRCSRTRWTPTAKKRTTALARETHAINSGGTCSASETLEAYKETLKNAPLDRLGQRANRC